MVPVLLSTAFGASFALFGFWFVSRQDLRLAEVRAKTSRIGTALDTQKADRVRVWVVGIAASLWAVLGRCGNGVGTRLLAAIAGLVASWVAGQILIKRIKSAARSKEMKSEWPTLLDGMAVAALAGLDIGSAFSAAAARLQGALREETDKVVLRLQGNMPLSSALEPLSGVGIPGAERLRSMLLQAEVLGTPVASTLEALALETSILEKQEMDTKFNALPFKMSLVTVLFLLPPVLMVSIAPNVLMFLGSKW